MKAVEYMVARAAMCKYYGGVMGGCCKSGEECPLHNVDCDISPNMTVGEAEQMQAIVKKWTMRNAETVASKFKEVFGLDAWDFWNMSNVNATTWLNQKYEK